MSFLKKLFGKELSTAEEYFSRAMEAYKSNKLEESVRDLEKAIELDPANQVYRNNLATFYGNLGNWKKAEAVWEELMNLSPDAQQIANYAATLSNMGYLAYQKGDFPEMIRLHERALSIDPNQPLALKDLGIYYQDNNRQYEKAISYLEQAVNTTTKPLGHSTSLKEYRAELKDRIATCYSAIGDYRSAIHYWEEALAEGSWDSSAKLAMEQEIVNARESLSKVSPNALQELEHTKQPSQENNNVTIFTFILWPNPGYHKLSQNQITMNDSQKEKMANSIRERVGIQSADVKVFAHSEWDAPIIKTTDQSEITQKYVAMQQGMKSILQKYGVPKSKLKALTKEVDGAPNPDWGFLTFWIVYKGILSSPSEQEDTHRKIEQLSSDSSLNKQSTERGISLSEISKERWKGLDVVVYGIPDYDRKGVCLGHAVGVGGMDLAEVLFEGEPTTKKYSPKFVELISSLPEKDNELPESIINEPITSQGENLMSNETTIAQYLKQLGAPATPFIDAQGATGLRFTTATYMGLQVSVQILNNQILMLQFGIGYPPKMNTEPLLRQLLMFNAMLIGVYFCILNDGGIMLRSSRTLEGLDFVEFKQSIDTICNAFMQNGIQVATMFQLSSQPQ